MGHFLGSDLSITTITTRDLERTWSEVLTAAAMHQG